MHGSQYVTNQSMHGSKYVTNTMKIMKLLEEKDELGQIVSCHNMLVKNLCIKLHSLASTVTALKIILIYV